MVDALMDDFGAIDILVNNAGITRDKTFLKMNRSLWDEVLGVNLTGTFNVTRAVLPGMVEEGWGRVINMASIVGQTGNFGQSNYAVTKGGLIAFTMSLGPRSLAQGCDGQRGGAGIYRNGHDQGCYGGALAAVKAMTPVGDWAGRKKSPPRWCSSPVGQASYITGQVIPVNGGMYM